CTAIVLGLAVGVALEHRTRIKLGKEHQALEEQLGQMAELVARSRQLSNLVARANAPRPLPDDQLRELLRLRGQIGMLRQQTNELEAIRAENRQARATLETTVKNEAAEAVATADYWPQDSWIFAGYGSPDAAFQTSLWAANNGDLKALVASATGAMQKTIEDSLGGKSDAEAQIKAMDEVIGFKSVRILNREFQDNDTAVLTAEIEHQSGTRTIKLLMKKIGNEWKISAPSG
ncbi:MAG TPA: hypothetical protein VK327_12710, partial [Candidatus Paceibacterota bacterium]|nr:hypothetical protein [Candidatus Paceibacterota bacterium]